MYLTTNFTAAVMFASLHPSRNGTVYEVLPVGAVEPDPDCNEPGLSWQAESAVILKVHEIPQAYRKQMFRELGISQRLL